MKKIGIVSTLIVTLISGCTTLDESNVILGDRFESREIGSEYLVGQDLGVEAKNIASVHVYLESTYAQDYEESYRRYTHNRYKTSSLSFSSILGGAAYGGLIGWALDATCDDEVEDCSSEYTTSLAVGGALIGFLLSAFDPDVSYSESHESMSPLVERKQRNTTRKQPLPNETVSISHNNTALFDRKTNSEGVIAISEQDLVDGGVHPLTIAFSDKVKLSMTAAGKKKHVDIPLRAADRQISSRLVSEQINDFLRDTSFTKLMTST